MNPNSLANHSLEDKAYSACFDLARLYIASEQHKDEIIKCEQRVRGYRLALFNALGGEGVLLFKKISAKACKCALLDNKK